MAVTAAAGYRPAVAGRAFSFPRDHAAHPEFATEWWYYTGHLRDADQRTYGYQLTFFRVGIAPNAGKRASAWAVRNVYFAHLALTDEAGRTFRCFDRAGRGSIGAAGADTKRYAVHVDDWSAALNGESHSLKAAASGWGVDLSATPSKPPALHGEGGLSRKGAGVGRASYYYSYTRMATTGSITVDGNQRAVTGDSWFDHEFGSSQLSAGQVGWDWFGVQLDDGTEIMLYAMRDAEDAVGRYSGGTLVDTGGKTTHLGAADFQVKVLDHWRSAVSGADYPSKWRIMVPKSGCDVTVTPTVADQELRTPGSTGVTYYEGSATVAGRAGGRPVSGRAYVELTGYAGAFGQAF